MLNTRRQPPVSTSTLPRLLEAMEQPNATAGSVSAVVSTDPGLAARALALANSARYGLASWVTRIDHAVGLLGMTTIRTLAIASASSLLERGSGLDDARDHAMRTGCAARLLAPRAGVRPGDAFAAGLLHDIGELLLFQARPTEYAEGRQRWHGPFEQLEGERARFGRTHTEVGAEHLALWGVPAVIVDAVAGHHRPSAASDAMTLVVAAAEELTGPVDRDRRDQAPDHHGLGLLGVTAGERQGLAERVGVEVAELQAMFAAMA